MNLSIKNEEANDWDCLLALNEEFIKHGISFPVNFACGVFTAVLSCKDSVPTQDWIKLFIAESSASEIDSANELLQTLLTVYNKIAMQLYNDNFKPTFLESTNIVDWYEGATGSVIDWCFGYCQGMELSPSIWLEEQYEYSMPIALLSGVIEINDEDPPTDEELTDLAMMIRSVAQSTYNIAFDAREDERALESKKNKIGRNNPCLCGSGMKYKKCCHKKEKAVTIH